MSKSNAHLDQVIALVKKIAHLQEGIDQTGDEKTKAELSSERDKHLNELKTACAAMPQLESSSADVSKPTTANDEPGYPTV